MVTGPHAITYVDAAAQLAAGLDRPVSFVNVPDLTFRDASTPDWFADNLVAPYQQLRAGVAAEVTDTVRMLTGHDPRSLAEFARDHPSAFTAQ